MLSGTVIASKSSPPESETDTLTKPRSSLTCVSSFSPVQPSSIEDLRTWLAQAFPVSRSPLQESKLEPTTSGTCGQQLRTLFASYTLNPFCLKTSPDLFPATTLKPSSVTWPSWGMWDAGGVYQQPQPAQITNAIGSGLLPTLAASDNRDRGHVGMACVQRRYHIGKQVGWSMLFKGKPCPMCAENTMGFPLGWTDLQPLGIARFQAWLQAHGAI